MDNSRHCVCEAGPFQTDSAYNKHRHSCKELEDVRRRAAKNTLSKLKSRKSTSRSTIQTTASTLLRGHPATIQSEIAISESHTSAEDSPSIGVRNHLVVNEDTIAVETSDSIRTQSGRVSKPSQRQRETNEYLAREAKLTKEPAALDHEDSRLPAAPRSLEALQLRSKANSFGLIRVFSQIPTHDPEGSLCRDDRTANINDGFDPFSMTSLMPKAATSEPLSIFPYPNESAFLLGEWYYASSKQKSLDDFRKLRSIIGRDSFRPEDIRQADWKGIHSHLGFIHGDKSTEGKKRYGKHLSAEARQRFDQLQSEAGWLKLDATWRRSDISITLRFPTASDGKSRKAIAKARRVKKYAAVPLPFQMKEPTVSEEQSGMFTYTFHDFYHRSIMEIIRDKVGNERACRNFHFVPYQLRWQQSSFSINPASSASDGTTSESNGSGSDGAIDEHDVFGEFYTSTTFMKAYEEVRNLKSVHESDALLERVVVALMFSSDVAHLTSFGDAEVWPLYMFFLNDSKYERAKPNENLCEQLAYFTKLPDSFKDFVYGIYAMSGRRHASSSTDNFFAHASKEFTQAQWRKLLSDPDFLYAYKHGKVYESWDGVRRVYYPRAFIYSADYKEKVQMATLRHLGLCPCPECLVTKSDLCNMGTPKDEKFRQDNPRKDSKNRQTLVKKARLLINKEGRNVDCKGVEDLLKKESLVPVENAFSGLNELDEKFNFFAMFLPDLLHEFLLGVWKAFFIHLLRLLVAIGGDALLAELDRRYRQMPTFGKDKIRKFNRTVSRLKAFAARDYEDLLQCAIPVFDGLIPEPYSANVMRLLFMLAYWYTLANLRMHTRPTVDLLKQVTSEMAQEGRKFSEEICEQFTTKELESEAAKRERKEKKKEAKNVVNEETKQKRKVVPDSNSPQKRLKLYDGSYISLDLQEGISAVAEKPKTQKKKKFVLGTYKWHRLGDYAKTIENYGTTDSYTTALGEHEHKKPKSYYSRTNKKDYIRQFVRIERRQARTRAIRQRREPLVPVSSQHDDASSMDPTSAYHISKFSRHPFHLVNFIQTYESDPAVTDFMMKLRLHLLPRVRAAHLELAQQPHCDFSHCIPLLKQETLNEADFIRVFIEGDKLFPHPIIRINYTTYDVRRDQDILSPYTSHCNLMVLANSGSTKYWYAKLLGIYHVMVSYLGPGSVDCYARRFDVLWVRWYHTVDYPDSWRLGKLETVELGEENTPNSFGFLDPRSVLRACHISPNYSQGLVADCQSAIGYGAEQYKQYYVLRFSDRDIAMRYEWGRAVGHTYARRNPEETVESMLAEANGTQQLHATEPPSGSSNESQDDRQSSLDLFAEAHGEDDDGESSKGGYGSSDEESLCSIESETDSVGIESEDDDDVIERLDLDDMYC